LIQKSYFFGNGSPIKTKDYIKDFYPYGNPLLLINIWNADMKYENPQLGEM